MTYERKKKTYAHWTAIEAGIIEDTRRHVWANQQIKVITENTPDEIETGVRLLYPLMACISPVVTWDEFIALPSAISDELARAAVAVNPNWDTTGMLTEEKKSNQPDGTKNSPKPSAQVKRPRHSRNQSLLTTK